MSEALPVLARSFVKEWGPYYGPEEPGNAEATMQKHGGTMEVQSVLGQGTIVTFRFPIPQPTG